MIGYISIGSYRIKGDDWQSHPLIKGSRFTPTSLKYHLITFVCHILSSVETFLFKHYLVVFNVIES